MPKVIKRKLKWRSKLTRTIFQNGKTAIGLIKLNQIHEECTDLILDEKENHNVSINEKLNDQIFLLHNVPLFS